MPNLSLVALLMTLLLSSGSVAPTISFARSSVTITTTHQEHPIALVGVRRLHGFYGAEIRRTAQIIPMTGGVGVHEFEVPIPASTVLVAADLETGLYVARKPSGLPPKTFILPVGTVKKGDVTDTLLLNRTRCQVLWIRPGDGAWTTVVADGGSTDTDGKADGKMAFDTSTMRTVQGGAPPKKYRRGDVILVIDMSRLQVAATEVAE